ncbi:SDR family oxidoreductase [Candidatus Woesearchaeota archaeon]|nr:SDR family oxidoreductase [Candidatus Woesearchaeota archaeon]
MASLEGKTVLVTGSAKGLGRATAISLAKEGAIVVVHYRSSRREAEATLAEVRRLSPKSILVHGDVTSASDVGNMFKQIKSKFGRLDILINNVGAFIFKPISETSVEEFSNVIDTNLKAAFLCSSEALIMMHKQKSGHIINFGCVGADRITIREKTTPYYIAKTGVYMLSKIMAQSEAKNGIRINTISPGVLETSVAKPAGSVIIKHKDIINAILYLLCGSSEKITGANIEVSGGWIPGSAG